MRVSSAGNSWAVFVPIRVFASWETSLLQKGPLQIRLVWSETSGFWAIVRRVLRRLLAAFAVSWSWGRCACVGVVHGRRVGDGTAWEQWGRVRVFLDAGGGGGGGAMPLPAPHRGGCGPPFPLRFPSGRTAPPWRRPSGLGHRIGVRARCDSGSGSRRGRDGRFANRLYGFRGGDARSGEWIGLYDGADAAVHVYGGAGYEAGSL